MIRALCGKSVWRWGVQQHISTATHSVPHSIRCASSVAAAGFDDLVPTIRASCGTDVLFGRRSLEKVGVWVGVAVRAVCAGVACVAVLSGDCDAASFGFVDDLRDMPTQLNDVAAEFPTRVCVITSNKGEQRVPVLMYFLQKVCM